METQNITLTIPKQLLRKVKRIALEKDTSISGLLRQMLVDLVEKEDRYQKARERHLALLKSGIDLGTKGVIDWGREELHDR
jgi:metal-responsive CopG/Arc/MetJ family transcriptional regulator